MTFSGCISNVSLKARALWNMIQHIADGVDSASSGTRIFTLGIDASQACGTISVEDAFRSAGEVWIAEKSGQTFACGGSAEL